MKPCIGKKYWRQQEERLLKDGWINLKSGYVFLVAIIKNS
ncbi:MAG: hypothetical protein ACJAXY_002470 [Nonlabens sp.]|jgi:hypothetical protein